MSSTNNNKAQIGSESWTIADKKILLRALEKYGYTNISKIKDMLPYKTTKEIREIILEYKAVASLGIQDINQCLNVWMSDPFLQKKDNFIAQALLLIHLFENHPPPEETAGFDIKLFYKFLYHTLMGDPPIELSKRTLTMLKDLQVSTELEVLPQNEQMIFEYLSSLPCKKIAKKDYTRKRK